MYANQPNYPTSAPPYVGVPQSSIPGFEIRHPVSMNRAPMPSFVSPEASSAVPSSALHLTPRGKERNFSS